MFVSLNKKIIYSILAFFLAISVIFVYTFYIIYGGKIQEEQQSRLQQNQQFLELLYRNIIYGKEIQNIIKNYPEVKISNPEITETLKAQSNINQSERLSIERKRIDEINQSYDKRYEAIKEGLKILGFASIMLFVSIIILSYLISYWILAPLNKISDVSMKVAQGNLSSRIKQIHISYFIDEMDILINTYNNMLDSIENLLSEIKDKEGFLQALIDSIPDGIRVINGNYDIIIANKAYYRQVGNKFKDCQKCYEASQNLKEPCNTKIINCPLYEINKNKKKNTKVVQQFCNYPNRHLSINAAPLNYSKNKNYIVESIRDLSEEINFSHQQKLSSLGFLSTSIAHEMKNHLGALRIITERLIDKFYQDKPDDDESKKHIMLIYHELISCIDVPERLLKLSRSNDDNKQIINCKESIKDVIGLLDFEAKSKGINIELKASETPLKIKGNEADFKMVAINIILNAIKAINNNGTININIEPENHHWVKIVFKDNGCGIAKDVINRIFDPFFSEGHTNSQNRGNGLGLSIAKSIVEKFGGNISVQSKINIGTSFTIKLPLIKNLAK